MKPRVLQRKRGRAVHSFGRTQERVEMVHKVLAPIKPTGGTIGIATIVAFAGAAACTQFLTLNMPFGGESGERLSFQPARFLSPSHPVGRAGDCPRSSIASRLGFVLREHVHRRGRTEQTGRASPSMPQTLERSRHFD